MLPSYIEDDVKAQITNDNELNDQYCLVFMSQKLSEAGKQYAGQLYLRPHKPVGN